MSVLIGIVFLALGAMAVLAIISSWSQCAASIAELRGALREPPEMVELRMTIQDKIVVRRTSATHRPKPFKHRLRNRTKVRAAA